MPNFFGMPYEYKDEALKIIFDSIIIDDNKGQLEDYLDKENHYLNLDTVESWQKIELGVAVDIPDVEINEVICEEETPENDITVLLILTSAKCRKRLPFKAEFSKNKWVSNIVLNRGDNYGTTKLQAYAVRTKDSSANNGRANKKGQRVADSADWNLYINEKPVMPGGAIDHEWKSFSDPSNGELNKYNNTLWYLDTSRDDAPKIILNDDIKGLKNILNNESRTGKNARARDTLISSIMQAVISYLMFKILWKKASNLDELEEWETDLITDIAKKGVMDCSSDKTAERWLKMMENYDVPSVINEVSAGIQKHVSLAADTKALIKELEE